MMVHNPDNGAVIADVWIHDKLYFSAKKQEEFRPGEIVEIEKEDDALYLLDLLGFLREVDKVEAEKILSDHTKEKFVCDVCNKEFKNKLGLMGHGRTHQSSLPGVKKANPIDPVVEKTEEDGDNKAASIDQEARRSGLYGEGLVQEKL